MVLRIKVVTHWWEEKRIYGKQVKKEIIKITKINWSREREKLKEVWQQTNGKTRTSGLWSQYLG